MPLELWDLYVGDKILWEVMGDARFPQILRDVLLRLRFGEGNTRSEGRVPQTIRSFDAAFISGGGAQSDILRAELTQVPFPVFFSDEGSFSGERGGLDLLRAMGCFGYVIDLGQSQLKISGAGKRWTFPRNFHLMPIRDDVGTSDYPAQRQHLRHFLAETIQLCVNATAIRPQAFVFALPSRLDNNGVPEGSSYAGMEGDDRLVTDVLSMMRLSAVPVLLVNDAELAALSALSDPRISLEKRTLVLTLGFGVGAALIRGRA